MLHNKRNLEQSKKEDYAFKFADQYEDKFIDFVNDDNIYLARTYSDNWLLIKQDRKSLLRYTNLNTFFMNNIKYMKEEVKHKINSYNF